MAAMDLSTYNAKTIYNVRMSLTKVFSEYIGTTLPRINWILTSSVDLLLTAQLGKESEIDVEH